MNNIYFVIVESGCEFDYGLKVKGIFSNIDAAKKLQNKILKNIEYCKNYVHKNYSEKEKIKCGNLLFKANTFHSCEIIKGESPYYLSPDSISSFLKT